MSPSTYRIPFLRPPFGPNERYAAYKCMGGSNISTGPERAIFEDLFRDYIGVPYALSVANGTIGLELVWETLIRNGKLKKGDKILLPSFTFVACANSIVQRGLVPVFCDINKDTWNIDPTFEEVYNCQGMLCVHSFGNPVDMERMKIISDETGCLLIEDCAEAAGASYNGRMCGSFGSASVFSFNATKNLTTGEGGVCAFQDKEDAETALLLAENGFGYISRNAVIPGHNYRLSNILCAVGIEQLKTLDERNRQRLQNAAKLAVLLRKECNINAIQCPTERGIPVYQIFGMLVEDRDKVYEHMIKAGVEVKKYFSPAIHEQYYYHKNYIHPNFPNTEYVSERILCLPFDDKLSDEEIGFMIDKISEVV